MNFFLPVLAAILQASSFTFDKVILSIKRVTFKTYACVSFPLIFIITFVLFIIFRPPLNLELFSGNLLWFMAVSVFLAIASNFIFYRALDYDKLGEIETIGLLSNIPIIIFSGLIFTDERKFSVMVPAFIASSAIVWSHWQRGRFKIARYTLPFLVFTIFIAPIRATLSKELLLVWNPISLELVRSGIMAMVFVLLFFRQVRKINLKTAGLLLATNILTALAWILYYFSFQRSGIVFTVLVFSLQPLLVYLASLVLLKESFNWKKVVAFAMVLMSIMAAKFLAS